MSWIWVVMMLLWNQAYPDMPLTILSDHNERLEEIARTDYIHQLPGVPIVNESRVQKLMDRFDKQVGIAPINATLNGAGRIVAERAGSKLDRTRFQAELYRYIYEGEPTEMKVPMSIVYPRVDSELLSATNAKAIGQYQTYYNQNNKKRSHNISLSSQAINNYVVFPGEKFSFNKIVGQRTAKKGYLRAPVIVRGEMYEDIGGGICQVSSTLFNAADRAGLTIIERYSHSKKVPYVPTGRDAAVSWGGPDLVFQNNYNHPILIRSYANYGQVSIVIRSSETVHENNRVVPNASRQLPEEARAEQNAKQTVE